MGLSIRLRHSMKIKMAATAVWRFTLYHMQDIVCERGSLKTAFWIELTSWNDLNTTETSDAIDLGHSTKIKMAATAVWRLTMYPVQDIMLVNATAWKLLVGLTSHFDKTSDIIDLGHSTIIKIAATAIWRLKLYPIQDIAYECGSLKTTCWIDFTFGYGLCTIIV